MRIFFNPPFLTALLLFCFYGASAEGLVQSLQKKISKNTHRIQSSFSHKISRSLHYTGSFLITNRFSLIYDPSMKKAGKKSRKKNAELCRSFCLSSRLSRRRPLALEVPDPDLYGFGDGSFSSSFPLFSFLKVSGGARLPLSKVSRKNHLLMGLFVGALLTLKKENYQWNLNHNLSRFFHRYTEGKTKWSLIQALSLRMKTRFVVIEPSITVQTAYDHELYQSGSFQVQISKAVEKWRTSFFTSFVWTKGYRSLMRKNIHNMYLDSPSFIMGFSLSV